MKRDDYEKAIMALEIIDLYNPLKNDLDSYLMYVTEWGLGKGPKPNPLDFGIDK